MMFKSVVTFFRRRSKYHVHIVLTKTCVWQDMHSGMIERYVLYTVLPRLVSGMTKRYVYSPRHVLCIMERYICILTKVCARYTGKVFINTMTCARYHEKKVCIFTKTCARYHGFTKTCDRYHGKVRGEFEFKPNCLNIFPALYL
jgi:hypothetical protein